MSTVSIRAALENALNGITPALATAWENQSFTPPATGTPYQIVNILFATPSNATYGSEHQELGYMQVKLMYPPQAGPGAAAARAELLRITFARGATFTGGGVNVNISRTPEITPGTTEDGRYAVVVKIPFFSHIP
jgi:hypothetical protein